MKTIDMGVLIGGPGDGARVKPGTDNLEVPVFADDDSHNMEKVLYRKRLIYTADPDGNACYYSYLAQKELPVCELLSRLFEGYKR